MVSIEPPKYMLCPGCIRSISDSDRHFITFRQLAFCYELRPTECVHYNPYEHRRLGDEYGKDMIWLYPLRLGYYVETRDRLTLEWYQRKNQELNKAAQEGEKDV